MDDRRTSVLEHNDADALMSVSESGEALFVINLCAANVPQAIDTGSVRSWGIAGIERYKLYQVSRMEDGRRRYRVRLGFFTSEAAAELVLQSVRGRFATAFSSCLSDEDVKHASGYLKKPLHEVQEIQDLQRTGRYRIPKFDEATLAAADNSGKFAKPRTTHAEAPPAKNSHASKTPKTESTVVEFEWSPALKGPTQQKTDTSTTKVRAAASAKLAAYIAANKQQVAHEPPPKTVAQPPVQHSNSNPKTAASMHIPATSASGKFHVGAGRQIPDHGFELVDDAPSFKANQPSVSKPVASKPEPKTTSSTTAPAQSKPELPRPLMSAEALAKLRAGAQPRQQATVIPTLDSTQTIRTLTKREQEDENAPKWYVVQLAISEQPANLDTMPRLDIFEAYRLYSVAMMDGAVIRHALRLGFFREAVSAEAVLGYLKTFFADPHIERVSDAEQKRFIDPPPPKPVSPAIEQARQARVITLEEKRPKFPIAEEPQPSKPTAAVKTASKSAGPATKRAAQPVVRKPAPKKTPDKFGHLSEEERTAIKEARMLGLSETAIRRVEHNPSLLSRLVGKLTK